MTKAEHYGHAALVGWRETVAQRVATPVAARAPLTEAQARGIVGAAFFLLSLYYVGGSVARMVRAARS